jgi:hypothetical protein
VEETVPVAVQPVGYLVLDILVERKPIPVF